VGRSILLEEFVQVAGDRVVVDVRSVPIDSNNFLKDFPEILTLTKVKVAHLYDSFDRLQSRRILSLLTFENNFAEIGVPDMNTLNFVHSDCRPEMHSTQVIKYGLTREQLKGRFRLCQQGVVWLEDPGKEPQRL
jgi:hypothetical protein